MSNTIKIISVVAGCALLLSMLVYLTVFLVQSQTTITDVTPDITTDNSILTIYGTHFGKERGTGSIQINNQLIPPSSYVLWSNSAVSIVLPDTFTSGVIELITHRGNVAVYIISHFDFIPIAIEQSSGARMNIDAITPQGRLSVGDVLTLRGTFLNHDDIEILLPHNIKIVDREGAFISSNGVNWLTVSEQSYIKKNSTEIALRIPTGVTSGSMIVRDIFGSEWRGNIEIDSSIGTQQYHEPEVYNLQFLFDMGTILTDSTPLGMLYPLPSDSYEQSIASPLFSSHRHQLFRFNGNRYYQLTSTDIASQSDIEDNSIRFTLQAKRYTVSTIITDPVAINRQAETSNHYFNDMQTNQQRLQSIAIADNIPNFANQLYLQRTRDIYAYVLQVLQPRPQPDEESLLHTQPTVDIALEIINGILSALSTADTAAQTPVDASALDYALFMFYLLNANDIPARLTVGLLFEEDATNTDMLQPVSTSVQSASSMGIVPHYWVSCYVPAIGWFPIDSAFGDGMYLRDAISEQSEYYFGNLDNRRIAVNVLSTLQSNSTPFSALYHYQTTQSTSIADSIDSNKTVDTGDKSSRTRIALFSLYE